MPASSSSGRRRPQGQPAEPDIVTSERQALVAEKAEINAVLGAAENLSIRVNGLIDHDRRSCAASCSPTC